MMNKFNKVFFKIILEEKFKNKKWKFVKKFKEVEIYFNEEHLKDRIKSRYHEDKFTYYQMTILKFIKIILEQEIFKKIGKTNLKSFTFHETSFNVWVSGVLQNDKAEKQYRIYISTFLPIEFTKYNKHDYFKEFEL